MPSIYPFKTSVGLDSGTAAAHLTWNHPPDCISSTVVQAPPICCLIPPLAPPPVLLVMTQSAPSRCLFLHRTGRLNALSLDALEVMVLDIV